MLTLEDGGPSGLGEGITTLLPESPVCELVSRVAPWGLYFSNNNNKKKKKITLFGLTKHFMKTCEFM